MNTKFMGGTSFALTEIEMQRVPGFRPRKSGMTVSRFSCSPAAGISQQECKVAGSVPLSDLLDKLSAEVGIPHFVARVSRLSAAEEPLLGSDQHSRRFWKIWEENKGIPNESAMCAAVYLLSADTFLWGNSVMAIRSDFIDFPSIRIHGVDVKGYVLFHTAKDLYKGIKRISLSELTDPELVNDDVFRLIMSAFLIRRYGADILWEERSRNHAYRGE